MPEPLRLDVELGAKGVAAGISEIGRETDGLRVSTQKASTAVRGFVMDLSQARDGADVASAALGAFAKILGTSLAGTAVVIAGKALVDAFLKVSESVKVAKDAVASANAEVAKMGSIRSFEDGARQAQVLSVAAEKAAAEIKKIESSKLQSFLADIRGAKEEMIALADATRKQADEAARAGIVQGAIDLERQKNLSEIDKKIIQSNESYNKLIDAARKLGDVELQNRLIIDQQRTASEIKRDDERKKEAQAQEEWYKRADAAWSAEAKATDAQAEANRKLASERSKSFSEFIEAEQRAAAERAKEHQKEVERSAQRISSLQAEIKTLQERGDALRQSLISAGGDIAMLGASAFGSGRGPGQRMTSGEVGTRRNVQRAEEEATRQAGLESRQIAKERILEREGPNADTSGYAITRELDAMATELAKQKALSPVEDYKKLKKQTEENSKALSKSTDELKDAQKNQEDLNKQTEENKATFEGVDYSVNRMGSNADMVSDALGGLSGSIGSLSDKANESLKDVDGLGAAAESANKYLSSLATEASNLEKIFSNFGEMDITTINTDSIVLN
jgi:hypothetical protein